MKSSLRRKSIRSLAFLTHTRRILASLLARNYFALWLSRGKLPVLRRISSSIGVASCWCPMADKFVATRRYNRFLAVAARAVRRSLKEEPRLQAERRGEMDLRFAKWQVRNKLRMYRRIAN